MIEDKVIQEDPRELMLRAKDGDGVAFGKLYELYFTPVYRYIYYRVQSKEEAEDLVQVVFVKVYRSISSFSDQGKSPLAYFFTIARNTIYDYWRKQNRVSLQEDIDIPDMRQDPVRQVEQQEASDLVRQGIQHLTDDQSEVITLKFINELSNQEIAELLSKSEESIRQLQSRGLQKLREHIRNPNTI